jgi:hypothetical protein
MRDFILKIIYILRYFRSERKMQEECPTLRYGDIIQIHGVNISNKDSTQGLIISKGYD